jgi:NAD(P)-dependent dehydrogenase (short-subunit alcohol dehydrogenase family)
LSSLENQVAVITGGLGDIGQACALELARRGVDVAVCDRADGGRAAPLRTRIEELGRRLRFDVADVVDRGQVEGWLAAVEQAFGPADILIANAAIAECASFSGLTPELWHRHLEVNLTGAFHAAHLVAERLRERRRPGRIVFIGSWAAHAPQAHMPAYCVSKAGLRMLCRCMALEYAADGILVNEVAPGIANAGLSKRVGREDPALLKRTLGRIPTGTLMEAEEVALHVAHLCDPRTRNIVGSAVLCDGGLSQVPATWSGRNDA